MAPTATETAVLAATPAAIMTNTVTTTTRNLLLPFLADPHTLAARNPHHTPIPAGTTGGPMRSDATMSDAERAVKLRNLTIGWTLGIVLACVLIGVTIFCVVGKRRCGLARRERDFTGYDARVARGAVPRAEDFDTRTDAEKRDERRMTEREEFGGGGRRLDGGERVVVVREMLADGGAARQ